MRVLNFCCRENVRIWGGSLIKEVVVKIFIFSRQFWKISNNNNKNTMMIEFFFFSWIKNGSLVWAYGPHATCTIRVLLRLSLELLLSEREDKNFYHQATSHAVIIRYFCHDNILLNIFFPLNSITLEFCPFFPWILYLFLNYYLMSLFYGASLICDTKWNAWSRFNRYHFLFFGKI